MAKPYKRKKKMTNTKDKEDVILKSLIFCFLAGIVLLTLGVTAFMVGVYSSGPLRWAGIIPGISMGLLGLLFLSCAHDFAYKLVNDKEDK